MGKRVLTWGNQRDTILIRGLEDGLIKGDGSGGFVRTDKYVGSCDVASMVNLERAVDNELWEMQKEAVDYRARQATYENDLVNGKINGVFG